MDLPSEPPGEIETEALYEALSHSRRIRVIQILQDADSSVTLLDLATEIVRLEQESDNSRMEAQVKEIRVSLYHQHIPKLADLGAVAYDPDEKRVAIDESSPLQQVDLSSERSTSQ